MSEHFIYFGLGLFAIYLTVIFTLSPTINAYTSKSKKKLFATVEKHNGKVTEKKFKNWVQKYEKAVTPKEQLISVYGFGIGVIGSLFLAYFIEQTQFAELIVFLFAVILAFGIIFAINLFSLISWRVHYNE